jgi:single-stranded-DNA-specific exonuclease
VCSVPPLFAGLCINRGITTETQLQSLLNASLFDLHNPYTLHGMEAAVERIVRALHAGERMTIYGDYDVDGVTATALLIWFFREIGRKIPYYLPHREHEGYGLHCEAIRHIQATGTTLLLTVDCGISAIAEVDFARELGMDVIITDHHQCPPVLPNALAILNPHQPDCPYRDKVLCGVGIAFKLITALRARLREERVWKERLPNLKKHLDLVALGTIADIVPLTAENHILAKQGLLELEHTTKVGLQALKKVTGLDKKEITATGVSFGLAPRLNAAGRIETARIAVELLITEDPQQAWILASTLEQANRKRQAIQEQILRDAKRQLDTDPAFAQQPAIVVASEDWHPGVIGIVASKLVEEYSKPTILISLQGEIGKGSGRSIPALHLYQSLSSCQELLLNFGGHKAAAGLTIDRQQIDTFRTQFNQIVNTELKAEDFLPILHVDAEVTFAELTRPLLEMLKVLEPFGEANPPPIFAAYDLETIGTPSSVGRERNHLRLTVRQESIALPTIGFRLAHLLPAIQQANRLALAFTPQVNQWNGREEIQLLIHDIQSGGNP